MCHTKLKQQDISQVIQIYQDRLGNELSREAALQGLTMIANNHKGQAKNSVTEVIPLSNLHNFLPSFFDLLKKSQRQLNLYTLECLEAFTRRYSNQFSGQIGQLQSELSKLIDDQDVQRTTLALQVATNVISAYPKNKDKHQEVLHKAALVSGTEL